MNWHEAVEYLRGVRKFKHRLVIKRVLMHDHGTTTLSDRGTITITVRHQDPFSVQLDTLMHELAHAAVFDTAKEHDAAWGRNMAIYRDAMDKRDMGE